METIIAPSPISTQELGIVLLGQSVFLLGLALFVTLIFTTILWLSYLFHKNSSIIDIGWSCSFLLVLLISTIRGTGSSVNKFLLFCMVVPWAIRLCIHLSHRFVHGQEDPRYRRLREKWGGDPYGLRFLGVFWLQGFIACFIAIPFYFVSVNPTPLLNSWAFLSYGVWLFGFVGETIADWELATFKREKGGPGRVMDRGMWSFCRHPNYFFEWIVWIGIAMLAWNGPWGGFWGLIPLTSPVLMLVLLLKVSGIPPLEKHLQETLGPVYEEYRQRVPPFFPSFAFWKEL